MARKSKFSEAQILGALKEIEGGRTVAETARKMGVSYENPESLEAEVQRDDGFGRSGEEAS